MKIKLLLTFTSIATIFLTSCGAPMGPNTQRGAATGAVGGAVLGGIIGHQSGRGLEGAALGGLGGAAIGGAVGNNRDQQQYNRY